jgi:integrase
MKKVLKSQNVRDYLLFVLGINSGLRVSDLLALKVSDVMDDRGNVKDRISMREKKTGKSKDFPIGKNARKAIQEYMATVEPGNDLPLFQSKKGNGAITRVQAYRILNEAARTVGIKERIGTHTLRKTFGYFAYKEGYDLSHIQKLLNHSSPGVTLRYIGITQEQLDEIYMRLDL